MKHPFAKLALLGLLLPACGKEASPPFVPAFGSRFSLELEEAGTPATRSLLQSADIETKVTCVTLGLYQEGLLAEKAHFTEDFDKMSFPLEDGVFTAYALVNMGDMSDALPQREEDLPSLTYSISGYTESGSGIDARGLPMAGRLSYTVGVTTSGAIPVKRLLAKVTADLKVEGWTGVITAVRVGNLNRTLRPFGESAAEDPSEDILPEQEYAVGGDLTEGSFTFYVPENRQGTIGNAASSGDKSPEGNAEIDERKALLTYLETEVTGTDGVDGTILYRSFLGSDATSNFDIVRNCRYTWTIGFLPDGRLHNDWKHENGLTWSEYRYVMEPAHLKLYLGELGFIGVKRHEDRYVCGVFHQDGGPKQDWSSHFSWSYNDDSVIVGSLVNNTYTLFAVGPGSRQVTATGPDGSLSCNVTVLDNKKKIILVASKARATVGERVTLHALLFTTRDGATSAGEDVTADGEHCMLYREGIEGYNPIRTVERGVLTASSPGEDRFSATYYMEADEHQLGSFGVYVCFEETLSGNLAIEGAETVGTVGTSLQLRAKFTPYSGGTPGTPVDVTSQVEWRIQDGEESVKIGTKTGLVSSTVSTAAVAHATYQYDGKTYRAFAVVRFNK